MTLILRSNEKESATAAQVAFTAAQGIEVRMLQKH